MAKTTLFTKFTSIGYSSIIFRLSRRTRKCYTRRKLKDVVNFDTHTHTHRGDDPHSRTAIGNEISHAITKMGWNVECAENYPKVRRTWNGLWPVFEICCWLNCTIILSHHKILFYIIFLVCNFQFALEPHYKGHFNRIIVVIFLCRIIVIVKKRSRSHRFFLLLLVEFFALLCQFCLYKWHCACQCVCKWHIRVWCLDGIFCKKKWSTSNVVSHPLIVFVCAKRFY